MKIELEEQLYIKYPELFIQKTLPITQSAMGFGIETGDGWFNLIDQCCNKLSLISKCTGISISFSQVKEKYGTLRLYMRVIFPTVSVYSDEQLATFMDIIDMIEEYAEIQSGHICEECGEMGQIDYTAGWLSCSCENCERKT